MKSVWKRKLSLVLVGAMLAAPVFSDKIPNNRSVATVEAASTGVNVAKRSKEEIKAYIKAHPTNISQRANPVSYEKGPQTTAPYSAGKLSASTKQSALNTLNTIRYIAGLNDNVTINDSYEEKAQAAALVNYVNNDLSHYPTQPSGMSDALYELGREGASSSNIAWASWSNVSLDWTLMHSWMADSDIGNMTRVGHRRWILNPTMGQTGFGTVNGSNGTYSTVYAFDRSGNADHYGVCWPAQTMPLEYFGNQYPWSVSMGTTVDKNAVTVTLTRQSDQKRWKFSTAQSDGAFYVNNSGYGQKGCIIFRPSNITYANGDIFTVTIDGLSGKVSYDVEFFSVEETAVTPTTTAQTKTTNTSSKTKYKVIRSNKSGAVAVAYVAPANKNVTTVTVPETVLVDGKRCKVTAIADNAFANCKKLKKVTIGKNITKIGKNAFYNCKKLKNITIKTTKLTSKKVGSKAFKGIYAKATIKVPKSKQKSYKKMLKAKGVGRKVVFMRS